METNHYHIQFTPLAFEDLDEIDSYITNTLSNEQAAERLIAEMEKSISQLRQFPRIGAEVEDAYLSAKGYRRLVVDNYLVFYLINEAQKAVIIMRILYGAREYHNLL